MDLRFLDTILEQNFDKGKNNIIYYIGKSNCQNEIKKKKKPCRFYN